MTPEQIASLIDSVNTFRNRVLSPEKDHMRLQYEELLEQMEDFTSYIALKAMLAALKEMPEDWKEFIDERALQVAIAEFFEEEFISKYRYGGPSVPLLPDPDEDY